MSFPHQKPPRGPRWDSDRWTHNFRQEFPTRGAPPRCSTGRRRCGASSALVCAIIGGAASRPRHFGPPSISESPLAPEEPGVESDSQQRILLQRGEWYVRRGCRLKCWSKVLSILQVGRPQKKYFRISFPPGRLFCVPPGVLLGRWSRSRWQGAFLKIFHPCLLAR